MRKTWGQVKQLLSDIADLCGNSEKLRQYANEAMEALWAEGDWIGKLVRYRIRVTGDCHGHRCITWPRQIEAIEAVSICNAQIGVRNLSFEFIENATGQLEQCGASLLGDRSEVASYEDVVPGDKKLRVYATVAEAANTYVLLLGYDDDNQWIRTQVSGTWTDGELVPIVNGTPATTTQYFSNLVGVQFGTYADGTWTIGERNGIVHLYEVDTANADEERWLSSYDYDETVPVYRRSILTNIGSDNCNCVTVLARARFAPVKRDTDYVQIGNVGAIKEMVLSIIRRNNDKIQEAEAYRARAIRLLNNELRQYLGNGAKKVARFMRKDIWLTNHNMM